MAILNEGIRKAAMWAPIQFKRDRPNEDLRLPSVIIFKDNVCEMKIGVFNLKDIWLFVKSCWWVILGGGRCLHLVPPFFSFRSHLMQSDPGDEMTKVSKAICRPLN